MKEGKKKKKRILRRNKCGVRFRTCIHWNTAAAFFPELLLTVSCYYWALPLPLAGLSIKACPFLPRRSHLTHSGKSEYSICVT